jgi:type I restriction enzyme S subunit
MKTGYKQTEVGVIPEDWDCLRVRDAASRASHSIVGGPFGSDLVSADYVETGTPVIRGQNMGSTLVSGEFVFVTSEKARALSANLARAHDIIFTQRGTLGQVSIVPEVGFERYLISQSQMKLSLDRPRHEPRFVHHYFLSTPGQKQIVTSAIQTGVPHTNLGILRAYRFPAPPLPEQRAIAAALSDVDGLLGALDRLIAKKRDLKQAAMQQLLTGQTRLPGFKGEWVVKTFGEVCWFQEGPGVRNTQFTTSGVKLLNGTNIFRGVLNLDTTTRFIAEKEAYGSYAHFMADEGDIVLASSGITIERLHEKVAFVRRDNLPFCMNTSTIRFKPLEGRLVSSFLFQVLIGDEFKSQIGGEATGSAQLNFGPSHVTKVCISLPPLPEQTAIASVLSEMDAELAALEQRREKTRALKQGMMQELLTGRTRLL